MRSSAASFNFHTPFLSLRLSNSCTDQYGICLIVATHPYLNVKFSANMKPVFSTYFLHRRLFGFFGEKLLNFASSTVKWNTLSAVSGSSMRFIARFWRFLYWLKDWRGHSHTQAHIHTHTHSHSHTLTKHTHTHTHSHTNLHTLTHIHTYTHTNSHTFTHTHTHYTHSHTLTHTTHIHTHSQPLTHTHSLTHTDTHTRW